MTAIPLDPEPTTDRMPSEIPVTDLVPTTAQQIGDLAGAVGDLAGAAG